MSDPEQVEAERDYQRRLGELHAARAQQAEIEAALRRLLIDRVRMLPAQALARQEELDASLALARQTTTARHLAAQHARERLGRLGIGTEPDEISDHSSPVDGFEQPPFARPL